MIEGDSMHGGVARRRTAVVLGIAALCLWVACDSLVPRQGWDSGLGPVVPHDTFPGDCSTCHTGSDWHTLKSEFEFDHERETGVALHGAHQEVACLMCHNDRGPVAQFAAQGCAGCHADPHRGQLGRTCSDCHDERTWRPTEVIQRHDRTRFPLVGAHAATACFRCHPGAQVGNFAGASPDCEHCHAGEYLRASYDHVANGFVDGCDRCHRPVAWIPAQVSHPASFPLTFGHGNRACTACHQGSTYSGLSTTCSSCHLDEYQRTSNPPHASNSFSTDCAQCHNTRGWGGGNFQHSPRFPLTNGHAGRQCSECHPGGVFTGQSTACATCHLDDYNGATNPPHASSGFSTSCEQCHNTRTWGDGTFNHRFPITSGAHRGINCNECHTTTIPAFSCTDCHEHSQTRTNNQHNDVRNYSYNSQRCYDCHPNGRG